MRSVGGLHHVTAIAGPAQENLDFYAGVLGMRLVKRSVNQDDPSTYHLFYADAAGHPGTDLTFFPWSMPSPPRRGHGLSVEVSLTVPPDTLGFWGDRLLHYGRAPRAIERRFGARALAFDDPHGLPLALVESAEAGAHAFEPWRGGPVAPERQVRGLHGARMAERALAPTAEFLTGVLGFTQLGEEAGWHRYIVEGGGPGGTVDVRETPSDPRGAWGVGSIHHLAWRVRDQAHQAEVRSRVEAAERRPTPVIDRFWFQSVYFLEPGGALFELATDGPGFAVDEAPDRLGAALVLPPWLEPSRSAIVASLPPLRDPPAVAG